MKQLEENQLLYKLKDFLLEASEEECPLVTNIETLYLENGVFELVLPF